jgi:hypothetical protein
MIRKTHATVTGYRRVIFERPAALWAARIVLVGDFNHGQPSRTPRAQARDGVWRAMLDLPMAQLYHCHYVINGEWRTDYYADGFALVASGCPTSLIDLT